MLRARSSNCQTDTYQGFPKRYCMTFQAKRFQNWTLSKFAVKKKLRHFGFEATPFATFISESLLFGRPGFESRLAQTLKACSFAALWSTRVQGISFETPITPLLGFKRLGPQQQFKGIFFYVKIYLFYFINGKKVGLICKALYICLSRKKNAELKKYGSIKLSNKL